MGEIPCHVECDPPSSLNIAQPVFRVLTFLAPSVEEDIEGDVGMAVIHAGLQSVTDICKFNSLFHKMFNFSVGENPDIIPMRHR